MHTTTPATWPDRTTIAHADKVAALKAISRSTQVLPTAAERLCAQRAAAERVARNGGAA